MSEKELSVCSRFPDFIRFQASVTRTRSGVGIREPDRLDPGAAAAAQRRASVGGDVKVKMEQQFQNQKVPCYQPQSTPAGPVAIATGPNAPPTILRRVTNADGTVSLVRTTTTTLAGGKTSIEKVPPNQNSEEKKREWKQTTEKNKEKKRMGKGRRGRGD